MKDVGKRTHTQLYNLMVVTLSDYFADIWGIGKINSQINYKMGPYYCASF